VEEDTGVRVDAADVCVGVPGDDERSAEECASPAEATVPCEFLTGPAGCGKTYLWRERIAIDPTQGLLCATTGIAAVNLGTVTLNSTLKFFDTESLRDAYLNGSLVRRMKDIREDYRRIVIDEVSMMDGDQLGILVRGALECNSFLSKHPPLGLTIVGDVCQLPPIKAKWCFESDEWRRFEANTTRLTKIWRQDAGPFLEALNLTRAGNGGGAAELLTADGLEWHSALDIQFNGTTIVSKNDAVSRYNSEALSRILGACFYVESQRWGKQRSEWGQSKRTGEWGIPPRTPLKIGAYVMLLSNSYNDEHDLVFANGDCGWIVDQRPGAVQVKLARNEQVVSVCPIVRDTGTKEKPSGWSGGHGHGEYLPRPHWMPDRKRFVEGQVKYFPMRLAYASTVHRSQGLSLDNVQIDIRDSFYSQPAMAYVSLSRCRTLKGLRIVGQRERFIRNCNIDERVRPWL